MMIANEIKTCLVVPLLILLAGNWIQQQYCVHGDPQVPCAFIFGDSLTDSGNNNNLPTDAKVNYKPYGIDFPTGPTGRFTNGYNTIDYIVQYLGFDRLIPPFANLSGSDILKGVNYASGSSGIRIESGSNNGAHISLGFQLRNHRTIVSEIAAKLGGYDKAKEYLQKCLYYVNIGSNDYINNYFRPDFFITSRIYNIERYTQLLIDELSSYLRELHDIGARKLVTVGIGYIGCTPLAISNGTNSSTGCVDEQNAAVFIFNAKLKSLVDQFNTNFSSDNTKVIFVNTTAGTLNSSLGFTVTNASCCPVKEDNWQCVVNSVPCQNRNEYIFWDGFHPTEAVNRISAITSYNGSNPDLTYPMDIKTLVQS